MMEAAIEVNDYVRSLAKFHLNYPHERFNLLKVYLAGVVPQSYLGLALSILNVWLRS